jgi:hypothetical protein
MAAWTDHENDLLRARYATTPGAELASLIGRSRNALQIQAHKLGLRRGPENRSTPASRAHGLRLVGRVVSAETRAKLSAANAGRVGAALTAEHRAKISAAKKGRRRGAPRMVTDGEPPHAA